MRHFFQLDRHRTTVRRELVAGLTTFVTMAYIIVINPAILEAAGIPRGPSMTATILAAAFGTLVMALYAKRPFAIAPYMGENAFITFTVVLGLGFTWQVALGAVFIAGILFTVLTLVNVRATVARAIPANLKFSFAVGIGLFVTFIGLNQTGIVTLGVPGAPVRIGNLAEPTIFLAVAGFILIAVLLSRRIPGALIIGMGAVTFVSLALGITKLPDAWVGAPPSLGPIFGQFDLSGALTLKALPVVVIIFIMAFVDTIGTLIGLSARAGLLDEQANLPEIEKPMLADAVVNLFAPLVGTTTCGAYVESASGIEEGGRTGLTALIVAVLFLLALVFTPFLTIVPPHAYGAAMIAIGVFMIEPIRMLNFDDMTELLPSFVTIALVIFTYNVGVGMTAGLILYPLLKLATGRVREVPGPMWGMLALSILFYLVYPWHN